MVDPETGEVYAVVTETADKTAWQGGFWDGTTWVEDTSTVITMLVGVGGSEVVIPRIATPGHYRYLGWDVIVTGDLSDMRTRLRKRCIEQIESLARLGGISIEQLRSTCAAVIEGIIGYYGRSAPIGREACNRIEAARRRALSRLGHRTSHDGTALVYVDATAGGGAMGFVHAYDVARAAFLDQQLKQMGDMDGSPSLFATQSAICLAAERLSFRPCREHPSPLDWLPGHLVDTLSEDSVGEAFYKYLIQSGCRTRRTDALVCGALSHVAYPVGRLPTEEELQNSAPGLWDPTERGGLGLPMQMRLSSLGLNSLLSLYGGRGAPDATHGLMYQGRWITASTFVAVYLRAGESAAHTRDDVAEFTLLTHRLKPNSPAGVRAAKWLSERANHDDPGIHRMPEEMRWHAFRKDVEHADLLEDASQRRARPIEPAHVHACRDGVRRQPGGGAARTQHAPSTPTSSGSVGRTQTAAGGGCLATRWRRSRAAIVHIAPATRITSGARSADSVAAWRRCGDASCPSPPPTGSLRRWARRRSPECRARHGCSRTVQTRLQPRPPS